MDLDGKDGHQGGVIAVCQKDIGGIAVGAGQGEKRDPNRDLYVRNRERIEEWASKRGDARHGQSMLLGAYRAD